MISQTQTGTPRRARRVALGLAALALVLAAGGALSFRHFLARTRSDPGFTYRDRATFEKLLRRARDAQGRGDGATAVAVYRFIVAVGTHGDATLEPYVAAARAELERLTPGSPGTPANPPR